MTHPDNRPSAFRCAILIGIILGHDSRMRITRNTLMEVSERNFLTADFMAELSNELRDIGIVLIDRQSDLALMRMDRTNHWTRKSTISLQRIQHGLQTGYPSYEDNALIEIWRNLQPKVESQAETDIEIEDEKAEHDVKRPRGRPPV